MAKKRTSVVIPVYNEKDYLERCLAALIAQEIPVYEIIVVDNNTSDGSVDRAREKYPKVKFIKEEHQGIVFARNTGFDAARGDIIVKLDADSLTFPSWHGDLLETIGNFDGWTGYVDNDELNKYFQPIVNWTFNFYTFQVNKFIARTVVMFGSNMAITSTSWQKIRRSVTMRNDIWEDLDMSLAMQAKKLNIAMSTHKGLKISARSANTTIINFYRRLLGQPRVYWIRRRWPSAIASEVFVHICFITWLILKPLSTIGQTIKRRPRPEQY